MTDVETNVSTIMQQKNEAAMKASRNPDHITVIAVSKGQPKDAILKAYQAGQRHFGESYAQEMAEKIAWAQNLGLLDIHWHFLGAIQTNKLKAITQASMIHSLSSLRHAQALNEVVTTTMPVFLQVNLDQNPKRQGFFPGDIVHATQELQNFQKLCLVGLMCIAPQDALHNAEFWFSTMNQLRSTLREQGLAHLKLSMGMSDDFQEAIAQGADYIRIGSSIFGARIKKKP